MYLHKPSKESGSSLTGIDRWKQYRPSGDAGVYPVHQDGTVEVGKSHNKNPITGYWPDTLTIPSSMKCWTCDPVRAQPRQNVLREEPSEGRFS